MRIAGNFNNFALLILRCMFSFLSLLLKTVFLELGKVFSCETIEDKKVEINRENHSRIYVVADYILVGLFLFCLSLYLSKLMIIDLDILFLLYLIIPFLYNTYPKYFPSVFFN
jgi:hypothetical protein